MNKRKSWGRELFFAIALTIICIVYLISNHGRVGTEFWLFVILAAHSWYQAIKFWPKS